MPRGVKKSTVNFSRVAAYVLKEKELAAVVKGAQDEYAKLNESVLANLNPAEITLFDEGVAQTVSVQL